MANDEDMRLLRGLRGIFWITAAVATGGLALALLPNDWDGIDGYDGGSDDE